MRIGQGADVTDLFRPRQCLADEPMRPLDFPQRPDNQRQVGHDGDADILGKTNDEIGIPFRIKHRERAFEIGARGGKISAEPVGIATEANCRASLGRARPRRDLAQHDVGDFPRRLQFAAHEAIRPEAEENGKGLGWIFDTGGQLAGAGESGFGFRRAVAARMQHRLAVAGLQFQSAFPSRGGVLHLIGFCERREQRLRLFDLRELRRRRKTFQHRREHGMGVRGAIGRLVELGQ
jgi:hypothetical protein